MIAFKHLISVHDVIAYRACATSAMREALNSDHIVNRILVNRGIKLEIIDGKRKLKLFIQIILLEHLSVKRPYLYIDVGGGSTELTFYLMKERLLIQFLSTLNYSNSAKISKNEWNDLKVWINKVTGKYANIGGIASGGNINTVNLAKKR